MSEYSISQVYASDKYSWSQIDGLLAREGIRRDQNLDYTCAMYDGDGEVIGTGSCFGSTLRCFAVSGDHQGEGLLNQIISHLIQVQYERGNIHLFLYTKTVSARFFQDLGFYEIARVDGTLVFMENRRDGFSRYLAELKNSLPKNGFSEKGMTGSGMADDAGTAFQGKALLNMGHGEAGDAAIVMNANPFTLGHQYLAEKAAAACHTLHIFVVSEDASLVPAAVRKRLVAEGTAHLPNVVLHDTGPYMISNATFPSYFLKDEADVIAGHARLDICLFTKIARSLGISARFVGEEPTSQVTGIYNEIMARELPRAGIACRIIPRKKTAGRAVSASTVRQCLQRSDWDSLRILVPETTLRYFMSPQAGPVLDRIRAAGDVVHY